ncbi:NAD(P)-dependent dehydrogenase (short-subunit alcohol dehydrogenase family) [Croceicoccus sp. BE223]|nr:NAD(P)-dependent dehydrogenase (short-subunit alcohol dehydrogenase family) [Croceicoccus sp. BE223]
MKIEGKTAVVTGGASGIGLGIVRALAAAKAGAIVIADIDAGAAEKVAANLAASGVRAVSVACDVSTEASMEQLADFAWNAVGPVDLLFNNAGVAADGDPLAEGEAEARWQFDVNLFGVMNGTRVFARRMIEAGRKGWICTTSSHNALGAPHPNVAGYVASKHASLGYMAAMQRQYGDKIGFSALCPGAVNTQVWDCRRSRPDKFGGPERGNEANAQFLQEHGLDPDLVGRMTVAGVENEEFFIFTHPEDIELVAERYRQAREAIGRQFPDYALPD